MAENAYYDQIMSLNGLTGFKEVIERWERFSENIARYQAKQSLVLPDLLWVSDNGIDKTTLLSLLTNYLDTAENLIDFYGNVNNVNIAIPESSRYGLAKRNFFGIVNTSEGYFDYYKGNVLDKVTDSSILDICENNTSNPKRIFNRAIRTKVVFFPNTLKYLYDNTVTPGYEPSKNYDANFYVFFSKTPPTMPIDKETGVNSIIVGGLVVLIILE